MTVPTPASARSSALRAAAASIFVETAVELAAFIDDTPDDAADTTPVADTNKPADTDDGHHRPNVSLQARVH